MPLASVTYPDVDGATTTFAVPFPYIAKADVHVYVDGVEDLTYTWPDDATVQPSTTPDAGTDVLVQRATEQDERLVDYSDASVLTEGDLDRDSQQNFYLMQELLDEFGAALTEAADGTLDATSRRITNVADATAAQDAVTKTQLDAVVAAAGNVPTPDDPGDDDGILLANGGTFDWVDPAAARVALSPLTADGDIWTRTGGVDARLALGATNGMVLGRTAGALGYVHQGMELVERADLTNGGADDLSTYELIHTLEVGYRYVLRVNAMKGIGANWWPSLRLRNAAGTMRNVSGDYYVSNQVVANTGLNNDARAFVPMYDYSGFAGIGSNASNASFMAELIHPVNVSERTGFLFDSMIESSTLAARGFGSASMPLAESHTKLSILTGSAATMNSGTALLWRIKEPS